MWASGGTTLSSSSVRTYLPALELRVVEDPRDQGVVGGPDLVAPGEDRPEAALVHGVDQRAPRLDDPGVDLAARRADDHRGPVAVALARGGVGEDGDALEGGLVAAPGLERRLDLVEVHEAPLADVLGDAAGLEPRDAGREGLERDRALVDLVRDRGSAGGHCGASGWVMRVSSRGSS